MRVDSACVCISCSGANTTAVVKPTNIQHTNTPPKAQQYVSVLPPCCHQHQALSTATAGLESQTHGMSLLKRGHCLTTTPLYPTPQPLTPCVPPPHHHPLHPLCVSLYVHRRSRVLLSVCTRTSAARRRVWVRRPPTSSTRSSSTAPSHQRSTETYPGSR